MMVMSPPQQRHGRRLSGMASGSGLATRAATPSSLRVELESRPSVEPARQDMDQKATDELVGGQRHDLLAFLPVAAIIQVTPSR